MYSSYCVSADGTDLEATRHPSGDSSITDCQNECILLPKCSAIEWTAAHCRLILTHIPSTKGGPNHQHTCYIRPVPGKIPLFICTS